MNLEETVRKLKKEKGYRIVSHYFTDDEIQNVSDFIGDSLELGFNVQDQHDERVIACTTLFMAETVKLLNPDTKVLTPEEQCQCQMVSHMTEQDIIRTKEAYPTAPLILYFNSPTHLKPMADALCTSTTALKVVESFSSPVVLFGPDKHIAHYISQRTTKKVVSVCDGFCYVHQYDPEKLRVLLSQHPDAQVVMHPECAIEIQDTAHFIGGTSAMRNYIASTGYSTYIVGCDYNLTRFIARENPDKLVLSIDANNRCGEMRRFNLQNLYQTLLREAPEVKINGLTPRPMEKVQGLLTTLRPAK
jgi:quinolinate synthase